MWRCILVIIVTILWPEIVYTAGWGRKVESHDSLGMSFLHEKNIHKSSLMYISIDTIVHQQYNAHNYKQYNVRYYYTPMISMNIYNNHYIITNVPDDTRWFMMFVDHWGCLLTFVDGYWCLVMYLDCNHERERVEHTWERTHNTRILPNQFKTSQIDIPKRLNSSKAFWNHLKQSEAFESPV